MCIEQYASDFNLYVSQKGNKKFTGMLPDLNREGTDGPFPSILKARNHIREKKYPGSVTVWLRGGRYFLNEPLVFGPEDSAPVTYTAYPGEEVILDGGIKIEGFKEEDFNSIKVWVTDVPEVAEGKWYFKQLFVNGERRNRPRLPKKGYFRIEHVPGMDLAKFMPDRRTNFFYSALGDIKNWKNLNDIDVVAVHYWNEERMPIVSFDEDTRKVVCSRTSTWPLKDDAALKYARYWVENVFEALCEPGEWYLDKRNGKLYYVPMPDEKLDEVEVYAPKVTQLLKLVGKPEEDRFVSNLKFKGITFEHTEWEQSIEEGKIHEGWIQPADRAGDYQASVTVPGIIYLKGARHCAIEDCMIRHGGFYGIEVAEGCMANRIKGNGIYDMGAGGIKIGGADMEGPVYERTGKNLVSHNHIQHSGKVFLSAVGILLTHTFDNCISCNHIHHLGYSGISCGWVWGYGESITKNNKIEQNHIHHLGTGDLNDMGGIYTLGNQPGTVIRHNLIHDVRMFNYGGWAIYLDEGSSQILIEKNICYHTDSEVLQQHYGRENVIRNNIFGFSKFGQISLSRVEEHISFTFEKNIILTDGKPVFLARNGETLEKHGFISDLNLFWDISGKKIFAGNEARDNNSQVSLSKTYGMEDLQRMGYDLHTIVDDPRFIDIQHLEYGFSEDSPALLLGFIPIER
jgi:hypothetical protein